ncbi:putative secreted protein (Por secretion system target) [Mariniflexile fucanivorans]|uniref:Putative secreted protein (Por secretion system target) n=1 Tax=Mariniflexile fucanivorans TaxID=264023 RepID=A0A4V2QE60_9FLAO|nr:family 16 glycosylhydrolase [Mariniflexile fucanivorans]TCL66847.1 putative secreted protein (Por secretion system target) [Mariniflexile fucanivorans]
MHKITLQFTKFNSARNLYFAVGFLALFIQVSNAQVYPLSDPTNSGNWTINSNISDEFDASVLNENKWLIQGRNGVFQSNFKGRAPSQFSTNNVRLEDGKLKLETRWEPGYAFSPSVDAVGDPYENITTAAVIAKNEFVYGYLEVKCKAADAEVTSSFWATGNNTEFDFFEFFGDHRQTNKLWKDKELWWSIHDWSSAGNGRTTYTESHDLGFRVADAFHTYGFDWSVDGVKIYIDGILFRDVPRTIINAYNDVANNNGGNGANENYVVTKPIKLWFDQETFPWHGVPTSLADLELNSPAEKKDDGVVDFEIEYLRVWQKGTLSLDDKYSSLNNTKIFPNPFDSNKFEDLYISTPRDCQILIYNVAGVELINVVKTMEPFKVSVSNLLSGFYVVVIKSGDTIETKKLIIN